MRTSIVLCVLTTLTSTAFAAPGASNPARETADDLASELVLAESVAQVYVEAEPAQAPPPERLVRQTSLYVGVPFFLTNRQLYRPGVGFSGRFGWEFGYIVPELAIGWQLNVLQGAVDALGNPISNLQNIWFSIGARIQFLNVSNVVPFVAAAFRPTWFSTYRAGAATTSELAFEPAITAGAGAAIELSEHFGLEIGVQVTTILSVVNNVMANDVEVFAQPYFGATYYY